MGEEEFYTSIINIKPGVDDTLLGLMQEVTSK
jgi:hypothetical protein